MKNYFGWSGSMKLWSVRHVVLTIEAIGEQKRRESQWWTGKCVVDEPFAHVTVFAEGPTQGTSLSRRHAGFYLQQHACGGRAAASGLHEGGKLF